MTQKPSILADRAVISVLGSEAHEFLQRVITTDMKLVTPGIIRPGALLTPQGKIICDFLIHGTDDGVMIDIHADAAEALVKRLTLYRLRAKAEIALRPDLKVIAGDGATDPRSPDLPLRKIASADGDEAEIPNLASDEITAGIPTFGRDYGEAEVFPTDVNLDLYDGIGWRKGCFIGQEVLSRMKRRGTIRKRSVRVTADNSLEAGHDILAGDTPIGTLTSASGNQAVGRIRTDRLETAQATPTVNGQPVTIIVPERD
ncbi:hypothetical protein V0U79_02640 [Hyphobacterium sp. HN65]|uniref:CAF17 C-terminal domain-containing protein n=1 Tax=Hyphobacterium lacteum TaxID=3116575 RepID=A0ABU7LMV9_9PROT|nr:hypothetical protein [Hyphobacterium sp. HN65]MEE2525247.1 hypothetical protein [Hyphobacterium sp. HN65]